MTKPFFRKIYTGIKTCPKPKIVEKEIWGDTIKQTVKTGWIDLDECIACKYHGEPIDDGVNCNYIKAGIDIDLTDVGRKFFEDNYPQGILWEYEPHGIFTLRAIAAEFIELTYIGVPYRMPHKVDGEQTWKKTK